MGVRRPPRGLRPEERELWRRVAETVRTRAGGDFAKPALPAEPGPAVCEPAAGAGDPGTGEPLPVPAVPRTPVRIGALRASTAPVIDRAPDPHVRLATAPLRMDPKAHRRLVRGRLAPEARIDLHGLSLAAAQPALTGFVRAAHAQGRRLILVITGKGRDDAGRGPLPYRIGALRHEVPLWLSRPPLSAMVQQIVPAHARHGGGGAYYVWLRRERDQST